MLLPDIVLVCQRSYVSTRLIKVRNCLQLKLFKHAIKQNIYSEEEDCLKKRGTGFKFPKIVRSHVLSSERMRKG